MKRLGIVLGTLALAAGVAAPRPAAAAEPTYVTAGAGGAFPAGTTFGNIDVEALQVGFGAEIDGAGGSFGTLTVVLLGPSLLDVQQVITLEGQITGGTQTVANVAVLTGLAAVSLGDGLPETPDVPFTLTLTKDPATNLGTVGLATGLGNLPSASLNEGSVSIQLVPPEPAGDGVLVAGP